MKKYIQLELFRSIITIVLAVAVAALSIFGLYGRSLAINAFLEGNQYVMLLVAVLAATVLSELLRCVLTINNAQLIKRWTLYLIGRMNENIKKMGYHKYHQVDYGEYISSYTVDIERLATTYFDPFLNIYAYIILTVVSLIVLFSIHLQIGLFSVGMFILLLFLGTRFGQKIGVAYQKFSQLSGYFTNVLQEYLAGYDILKNFSRLDLFKEKVMHAKTDVEEQRVVAKKYTAFAALTFYGFQKVYEAAIFIFAIVLVSSGELSVGFLVSVPAILSVFLNSGGMLFESVFQIFGMNEIGKKLEHIEDTQTYHYCDIEKITLQHIHQQYEEHVIFDDLSYTFESGKKYALLGPSGSGKSTLIKLLLGRLIPQEGKVILNDDKVVDYASDIVFSDSIAYVSQENSLFDLSVKDNITLGLLASDEEIESLLKQVQLYDTIMQLPEQLQTNLGMAGAKLSGGERQRIGLARALFRKTPILILDEATSAIDKQTAVIVEQAILQNDKQMVIMISHHLDDTIKQQMDDVIYLH